MQCQGSTCFVTDQLLAIRDHCLHLACRFHPVMISPHRAQFRKGAEALDFHAAEVQVLEHHDDSVNPGGPFLVDEAFNPLKRSWNKARWSRWACVGGQASAEGGGQMGQE